MADSHCISFHLLMSETNGTFGYNLYQQWVAEAHRGS